MSEKTTKLILFVLFLISLGANAVLTVNHIEEKADTEQRRAQIEQQRQLISVAYSKENANIYTNEIQLRNGELYIPFLYTGTKVMLITNNFSKFKEYNMNDAYRNLNTRFNPNTSFCVSGGGIKLKEAGIDKMGNQLYEYDENNTNLIHEEYSGWSCVPLNQYIALDEWE